MKKACNKTNGYFEIAREASDLSFDEFSRKYYDVEQPVVIEGVGLDWLARHKWSESYLHEKLSGESSASAASLWYWMDRGGLEEDYDTPSIVSRSLDSEKVFPRSQSIRVWIHQKGNVSSWHYDGSLVSVFNAQVKGRKEWLLVSPETPLDCYPFTNFAIIDGKDEEQIFQNKICTKFILNEGDMLFLPPLWFHKVLSCDDLNVNINWLFTKKESHVVTKSLVRELQRYGLLEFFTKNRFSIIRTTFKKLNARLPGYLKITWRYNEMIQSTYKIKRFDLVKRVLKEWYLGVKVLVHIDKIKPYLKTIRSVKKLEKN